MSEGGEGKIFFSQLYLFSGSKLLKSWWFYAIVKYCDGCSIHKVMLLFTSFEPNWNRRGIALLDVDVWTYDRHVLVVIYLHAP